MNKRYMDFVPTKGKKVAPRPVKKPEEPKKPVVITKAAMPVMGRGTKTVAKSEPKVLAKNEAKLGVIEDLGARSGGLVSAKHFEDKKSEIRELKAKKVGMKEEVKASSEKASGLKTKTDEAFKTPKTPFINQDKIAKRPLSKNIYRKTPAVVKEEPKGPVTIITKPEKSAKISLVITIIITIILGAAAGTVAFLLLPK